MSLAASDLTVALPAPSSTMAESDALARVAERVGGKRIGVVGDVPRFGPELLFGIAACTAGVFWGEHAVLLAVVLAVGAAQVLGAGVLNGLLPRRPSWAVLVGELGPKTEVAVIIPTDLTIRLPMVSAALWFGALVLSASAPGAAAAALLAAGLCAYLPGPVPLVSGAYAELIPIARERGWPLILAGASRREARGALGALNWTRAQPKRIVWATGREGGVAVLTRGGPWTWESAARSALLEPAVLRLWLAGFEVWVVGTGAGATLAGLTRPSP